MTTSSKNSSNENQAIVIFSGFNQRAIIAFIRTLKKNSLPFYIIALSKNDPIFETEYKTNVSAVRKNTTLNLDDIGNCLDIVKTVSHTDKLFIAPSTEALNRFLLANRVFFEKKLCTIPLVDEELYKNISDKKSFEKLCIEHGINVPQQIDFNKENIPFVIKPRFYENGKILNSPILVENLDIFKKTTYDPQNYYCQKYIAGKSYYFLYHFSKNGSVQRLIQENLLQQAQGKSITAAKIANVSFDDNSFVTMFQSVGFHGLVMVEVRQSDNHIYMIEANPRFWGPSQLFVDYGLNFFEHFLVDYGFNITNKNFINTNALYYWSGGRDSHEFFHNKLDFLPEQYSNSDIYKRNDTMGIYKQELVKKLVSYYNQISKHSQYQILAKGLSDYINQDSLGVKSRAEHERLTYILQNLSLKGMSILDIGANTGFFSFEALDNGAKNVTVYEGNSHHANFISIGAELLSVENQIHVQNEYFSFNTQERYDITFLLNVLHHVGDDYGDPSLTIENAKKTILKQLNNMSNSSEYIAFQLGFNWKGNRNMCLFPHGTKEEMIEFIKQGVSNNWKILNIGVAEKIDGQIVFKDLSDKNIARDDTLGEFLNRPIFIMKSKEMGNG